MRRVSHLATLGEMAGAIAHEINQPLTAISNFAVASERLLAAPEPDLGEIRDALRQIAGQAMRAGEIIRRIRELVRSRETSREPADINGLIREVWALTHADARLHGVRQLAEELPAAVVDGIQIQQVLLNLIHNGIEALMGDTDSEREVIVRSHYSGRGEIEISVVDSGPGVNPSLAGRIFEPFCTTKEQGTGLGLAISRTIVEAHRGRLEYRPNVPHGACFIMTLPSDRAVAP
jgi:C4-dicarboxylate-specific signal transduction histidine kinase